jgi:hypothetical protein
MLVTLMVLLMSAIVLVCYMKSACANTCVTKCIITIAYVTYRAISIDISTGTPWRSSSNVTSSSVSDIVVLLMIVHEVTQALVVI